MPLVCDSEGLAAWGWGGWGGWAILCMSDTPLYTHPSCALLQDLHFTPRQKIEEQKKTFLLHLKSKYCLSGKEVEAFANIDLLFLLICDSLCPSLRWRRFYSSQPHCNCGAMLNVDLFLTQNNATLGECSVKPVSVTASACETVKQVGGLRGCLISPSTRNKPNILSRWRIILMQYFGWWLALCDISIFLA